MTRPSPGPTNVENINISKKVSYAIGALNRVRPFINTHSAPNFHQALTLNDKRNWAISRRSRPKTAEKYIMIPTHICSLVIKPTIFVFYICLFLLCLFVCLFLRCCFLLLLLLFLRSCCCRVVGSCSEFENVAKKVNLRSSCLYRGDYYIKSRSSENDILDCPLHTRSKLHLPLTVTEHIS